MVCVDLLRDNIVIQCYTRSSFCINIYSWKSPEKHIEYFVQFWSFFSEFILTICNVLHEDSWWTKKVLGEDKLIFTSGLMHWTGYWLATIQKDSWRVSFRVCIVEEKTLFWHKGKETQDLDIWQTEQLKNRICVIYFIGDWLRKYYKMGVSFRGHYIEWNSFYYFWVSRYFPVHNDIIYILKAMYKQRPG